jgi:hypothetical protein
MSSAPSQVGQTLHHSEGTSGGQVTENLVTGFVYLIKSGKYYKIGMTNSIDRRKYEIGLHAAEGVEPIHSTKKVDSSGIEAYWHNRFKCKRMNSE